MEEACLLYESNLGQRFEDFGWQLHQYFMHVMVLDATRARAQP